MVKRGETKGKIGKKALSPIIATVLLIILVIIIALIIFIWIRGFIREAILKQGARIEQKCGEVNLEAGKTGTSLRLDNRGNVPVYNIEIKIKSDGRETVKRLDTPINLQVGGSDRYEVSGIDEVDSVIIVPVLMGETKTSKQEYTCTEIEIEALTE